MYVSSKFKEQQEESTLSALKPQIVLFCFFFFFFIFPLILFKNYI